MLEDYQYSPLWDPESDFRLIRIQPGTPDDGFGLRCQMFACKQRLGWVYNALSYTWGDTSIKTPILLNGKRFFVTPSLETALRNLRSLLADELFHSLYWIDTICIDRENADERDQQVRRMKHIYKSAREVHIWLGESHDPRDDSFRVSIELWGLEKLDRGTDNSVEQAANLVHDISELYGMSKRVQQRFDQLLKRYHRHHMEGYTQDAWAQLARLFYRSWFERLWIIQELEAADTAFVVCGQNWIPWKEIENAAAWIIRPGSDLPLQRIMKILPRMGAHRVNQEAKCIDPRDRLYAILGVVEDTADNDIDYSIPLQLVYRNWAERRIRRTGCLDVPGACANTGRYGELPSWVPDLQRPWGQDKSLWVESISRSHRTCLKKTVPIAGDESEAFSFSECGMRLSVSGQCLDSITSLSDVGDVVTRFHDPAKLKDSLLDIVMGWEVWAIDRGPLADVGQTSFLEVILRNFHLSYYNSYENGEEGKLYRAWRGRLSPDEKSNFEAKARGNDFREFERRLFPKIHGCQLFITESGNMGAVAGNCQSQLSDEVWVLNGGLTPFVLRRTEQGHRVISPCYLAGHMEGLDSFHTIEAGVIKRKYQKELQRATLV